MKKEKIVVLYGGDSPEREVSLESGKAVLAALQQEGFDVQGVDAFSKELVEEILRISPDVCYIALHGEDGENGRIQALLEILKIKHTASDTRASVITMDKMLSKEIWERNGLLTPKARLLTESLKESGELNFPVVIKPTSTGSSIGITKVNLEMELELAYKEAAQYGEVMIEEWITGKEMTVAVLNDEVFSSVWIEPKNEFYDYESKYGGQSIYHSPSGLPDDKELEIRELAKRAYDVLGCKGHARVDFIYSDNKFYLIEINTSPGMTEHSLSPKSAKALGYSFNDLVKKVVEQAK
ncbi:D-alanine--D-alanine ligase [Francisella frigiditurris]|uniref:D-alanine--D-alanine ligase n=1 Tax=Francisella frigiditurris TaxID=1542390 RepID=A0A1J0KTW3_9GAMM|nr:D-alanine--D-alanine ligase [Francisella frigiditurris]APC97076.1 D-alanine--D-alanine ligase B [Francisella frigiditurris]